MTVKEFALRQLHWIIRKDPWVQNLFNSAGVSLDEMAERIVAIWNFDDFEKITAEQCAYYESLLGIKTDLTVPLDERRAAVQAAWRGGQTPTLQAIQSICDAWEVGGVAVSYEPGELILSFQSGTGTPKNLDQLEKSIATVVPAHLIITYIYRYLLIRDIHNVKTLTEMEAIELDNFAGGG